MPEAPAQAAGASSINKDGAPVEPARGLPPPVAPVRLLWSDSAGLRRCRVVPGPRYPEVLSMGVGVTKACMAQTAYSDSPAEGSGLTAVGEVRLTPDDATRVGAPWSAGGHQIVMCDFMLVAGLAWSCCPRQTLKRAIAMLKNDFGLELKVGYELEFTLLESFAPSSSPVTCSAGGSALFGTGLRPVGHARYSQSSALDAQADVLDDMVTTLQAMDIGVEQWHAESAPGQFEISLAYGGALEAADKLLLAREAITAVARKHGLYVSYLPKMMKHQAGNGCHCHMSLWQDGSPRMNRPHKAKAKAGEPDPTATAMSWTAGLLQSLPALLAFTTPSPNSFERFRVGAWAGAVTAWGWNNREAPIRMTAPNLENLHLTHIELKAFDHTANPHLALTAIIAAGTLGLRGKLQPPEPLFVPPGELPPEDAERMGVRPLPASLRDSLALLEGPEGKPFHRALCQVVKEDLLQAYLAVRHAEAQHASLDLMPDLLLRYS